MQVDTGALSRFYESLTGDKGKKKQFQKMYKMFAHHTGPKNKAEAERMKKEGLTADAVYEHLMNLPQEQHAALLRPAPKRPKLKAEELKGYMSTTQKRDFDSNQQVAKLAKAQNTKILKTAAAKAAKQAPE
jgi:hypothetical protein